MSTLKTQENDGDVVAYLQSVRPERRRKDAMTLLPLFQDVTDLPARMWGDSLVGFGAYDYTYKSGHSGRWPLAVFSPRKAAMSVYVMPGFGNYSDLLDQLGPHKHSVSCLYLTRLDRVDLDILRRLIARSVQDMRQMYPEN